MKKTTVKFLLIHFLAITLGIFCVLQFAEEILQFKKSVYTVMQGFKNQTESAPEWQEAFADYAPMTHSGEEWYQDTRLIYHAGGAVDGFAYTNSKEALENTLANGNTVVEIDFLFTLDGSLICAHTWEDLYALEPLTLKEVQDVGIYRKYTPMTAEELIGYMKENPDLVVIVDTKEEQPLTVMEELVRLSNREETILNRFVIQLYDRGMKQEVLEIYPFHDENFLFTAYEFGSERVEEIMQLCYEENIRVVTVVYYSWSQEVVDFFREKGIVIFEHTVNDAYEAKDIIASGVQGVYTDFLQKADMEDFADIQ